MLVKRRIGSHGALCQVAPLPIHALSLRWRRMAAFSWDGFGLRKPGEGLGKWCKRDPGPPFAGVRGIYFFLLLLRRDFFVVVSRIWIRIR